MRQIRNIGLCIVVLLLASSAIAATASATSDGVAAWGESEEGQLGYFGSIDSVVPRMLTRPTQVTAVSAGSFFSLALRENETVVAWGENSFGQLGDGATGGHEKTPVEVHELSLVSAISAGEYFGLALLKDGKVMAWGENKFGELGDGKTENTDIPVEVHGLSEVVAISAGEYHSLALLKDGKVMAWGLNLYGELGVGTSEGPETCSGSACSTVPVEVHELDGVTAVSAGSFSLALLEGSKVKAWGANRFGELGVGTDTGPETCDASACSTVPTEVHELGGVKAVSAGDEFALALLEHGKVMSWGSNVFGELGYSTSEGPGKCTEYPCSTRPVEVHELSKVTAISASKDADGLALLENGTVMAWGLNEEGELGDDTSSGPEKCSKEACSRVPVLVSDLRDVVGIAAGPFDSYAYGPPGPAVTAVSPGGGEPAGGTRVTITGSNFTGVTEVDFGPNKAEKYEVVLPTEIVALSPAGTGKVHVTVTTSSGMIATSRETDNAWFQYASASAPEFGRCVAVAKGTGRYSGAACTGEEAGGSYEWTPGVAKTHFTLSSGGATFLAGSEAKVACKAESGVGEYSGPKETVNTVLDFTGCEYGGARCTTAGAAEGEVVTNSLEGELGWKNVAAAEVGLDLAPTEEGGLFAKFICGTTPVTVQGSVIGVVEADKMLTSMTIQYSSDKGTQKPERLEGDPKDVLEFSFAGGKFAKVGLKDVPTQTSEEAVEVNATV